MRMIQIVCSPSGGTQKAANHIAAVFGKTHQTIDLCAQEKPFFTFEKEDLCIIAVPSFGGRVPAFALSRLKTLQGNRARAILLVTYGNRDYEDTLLELYEEMEALGFYSIAGICAVTEHSIVRQFAKGRPDEQDQTELETFALKIQERGMDKHLSFVPGNKPYKPYGTIPMVPQAMDDCISCGLCAKACPVKAISFTDQTMVEESLCVSCMRCVSVCPYQARKVADEKLANITMKLQKVCAERKENELFL